MQAAQDELLNAFEELKAAHGAEIDGLRVACEAAGAEIDGLRVACEAEVESMSARLVELETRTSSSVVGGSSTKPLTYRERKERMNMGDLSKLIDEVATLARVEQESIQDQEGQSELFQAIVQEMKRQGFWPIFGAGFQGFQSMNFTN